MSTKFKEIFEGLAGEIPRKSIRVRNQRGDRIAYITARVAQNRLDEVLGPENWECEWKIVGEVAKGNTLIVLADCTVRIRLGDQTVSRSDTGGASNPDPIVARKGAVSDAFKRACVQFGIGRELYGDGVADFEADEIESVEPSAPPQQPRAKDAPKPAPAKPKPAVSIARLAQGVGDQTDRDFWAWLEGFIKEEGSRLEEIGADPESGELPPDWKNPANAIRLINHLINWLNDRGLVAERCDASKDNKLKARAVAYAWAKEDAKFQGEFDREVDAWRDKLSAEAVAWRTPSKPKAGA